MKPAAHSLSAHAWAGCAICSNLNVILQLTKQLFEHVWSQWCFDTQQIASGLPQALANQTPGQPLLLSLERWLILLKVPHPHQITVHMAYTSTNEALTTPEVSMYSCYSTVYSIYTQQSLLMGLALYIWTHGLQCNDWNLCLQKIALSIDRRELTHALPLS